MIFWSLCLSGAILAQKLNSFICKKINLIFWHPWDPWGRVHIDLNKNSVRTGCVCLSTQFINSVKSRQTRLNLTTKINLNIGHQQLDAMIRTQHFLISTLDRKKCFPSKAINEIHLTIVTLYRRGVKLKLVPFRVVESIQDLIFGRVFKT